MRIELSNYPSPGQACFDWHGAKVHHARASCGCQSLRYNAEEHPAFGYCQYVVHGGRSCEVGTAFYLKSASSSQRSKFHVVSGHFDWLLV